MGIRPIDMLVNFLGMSKAAGKIQEGKNNVVNQQIVGSIQSEKDSQKNNTKIINGQNLESAHIQNSLDKQGLDYSKNKRNKKWNTKYMKSNRYKDDLQDKDTINITQKGQKIDMKE